MTDWKPGDRFRLECEGEVGMGAGNSTEGHTRWAKIDGLSPNGVVVSERWLDAHAIKIQRPFLFGDLVEFKTIAMDRPAKAVVVVNETPAGLVQIWCKNAPSGESVPASHLTLMEDL